MITRRHLLQSATALAALPALGQSGHTVTLPKLPYATDALEPYIDAQTMEIHHGRHHQAYVDNLNKALSGHPALSARSLERLLAELSDVPETARTAIRNNGGGHLNHSLFWKTLGKPAGGPKSALLAAINKAFGNRAAFEEKLRASAMSAFGSGWVWVMAPARDSLQIETSPNQDGPWMSGRTPLFGIDVWEHAYYLKYQNRRADYIAALMHVINWDFVSQRYEEITE
jgi:Fe-Mn family superoxide dismutase